MQTQWGKKRLGQIERVALTYIHYQAAAERRELSLALCDDLEGRDESEVGGRLPREGIYVYISLIHLIVRQKPAQPLYGNCTPIKNVFK